VKIRLILTAGAVVDIYAVVGAGDQSSTELGSTDTLTTATTDLIHRTLPVT